MSLELQSFKRIPQEGEQEQEPGHRDVIQAFNRVDYPLSQAVQRLLLEEDGVFTNRKGSGYTQFIYRMFNGYTEINTIFDESVLQRLDDLAFAENYSKDKETYVDVDKLMQAASYLSRPDSLLIARLIVHRFKPYEPKPDDVVLKASSERPRCGACTTAETYYLEFVNSPGTYNWRGGDSAAMNVIVDSAGEPVMLEKEGGLGDNFSCITLRDFVYGHNKLPAGTLLAVEYPAETATQDRINFTREKAGSKEIPLEQCKFRVLRFTTLAVPPEYRAQAFGEHLEWQQRNHFPDCESTTIEQLAQRARQMFKGDAPDSVDEDTW